MSATVFLVGAGPGDPGLLTVRGRELLESADVVLYDRLGTEHLLHLISPEATAIDVGKAPGAVAMTQEEINATLIERAAEARRVVRLKGGDPFVFGRGGEEALALGAAGIAYEIVPGITSAIAAPAYAGIPVTHRGRATSFTVVTGHEDPTKPETQTDWAALARAGGTLVVLMGMGRLAAIVERLREGGRPADEPVAIVQWGTGPRQRSVSGTLADIVATADREGLASPAVIVVGAVAALAPELAWRSAPLLGRRVVVTRARAQASDLSAALRDLGAEVIELPTIRIAPLELPPDALDDVDRFSVVVLTSVNGVDGLCDALLAQGRDVRALDPDAITVAIGPVTAQRMRRRGLRPGIVPKRFVAEGLLEALADYDLAGREVLVARARGSRPELVEGLRARGASVRELHLYEAVAEPIDDQCLGRALDADYLTFTASSTVRHLVDRLPSDALPLRPRAVSIGPITSATLRDYGIEPAVEAAIHTIPGVVEALLRDAEGR